MNDGKFNLDNMYTSGPINKVTNTTIEAANAKLAISYH